MRRSSGVNRYESGGNLAFKESLKYSTMKIAILALLILLTGCFELSVVPEDEMVKKVKGMGENL